MGKEQFRALHRPVGNAVEESNRIEYSSSLLIIVRQLHPNSGDNERMILFASFEFCRAPGI